MVSYRERLFPQIPSWVWTGKSIKEDTRTRKLKKKKRYKIKNLASFGEEILIREERSSL